MNKKKPFIMLPHSGDSTYPNDISPQDILIYLAIKNHMNKESYEAFPSYATISKEIGAAINTVRKSVVTLQEHGYFSTRKEGKKMYYVFPKTDKLKHFEPFSREFLYKPELTFMEKAYIAASQRFMLKNEETGEGEIFYPNSQLSKLINFSESTISKYNHSLESKGYLTLGTNFAKRFQLRELDQLFIWKFKEQDEKLQDHDDQLQKHKEKIRMLEDRIAQLEKQTNSKPELNITL